MTEAGDSFSFGTPMKQAKQGFLLESANLLKEAYKIFGVYLVIVLFRRPGQVGGVLLAYLGLTAVILLYSWFLYKSVRFFVDYSKGEFIFKKGVFTKRNITIHLDRIQQVNLMQHILQRLLNVYTVEINTAGSEKTEVVIHAVSLKDAVELKRVLLGNRERGIESENQSNISSTSVLKISNSTILKIALTSRYGKSLAILIAFWGSVYNQYNDIFTPGYREGDEISEAVLIKFILGSTLFLILAIILFWILFNIITGFLRFYNYRIQFKEGALQVTYGSFKTNQIIIHSDKVQMVEIITNFLQRKMNLSRLIFKQASSDFERDKRARVEIPGCSLNEEKELITYVLGKVPQGFTTVLPNYRKIFRPLINLVIIPFPFVFFLDNQIPHAFQIFLLWSVIVAVAGYFSFRHSKLLIADEFILMQSGIWDISRTIMEPYKIQGIKVTQRLWHRRAGIAHITLYTAADNIVFRYVLLKEIQPYLNKWVFNTESSDKNWI